MSFGQIVARMCLPPFNFEFEYWFLCVFLEVKLVALIIHNDVCIAGGKNDVINWIRM